MQLIEGQMFVCVFLNKIKSRINIALYSEMLNYYLMKLI